MSSDTTYEPRDVETYPSISAWVRVIITSLLLAGFGAVAFAGLAAGLFWTIRSIAQAIGTGLLGGLAYAALTIIGTIVFTGFILFCHARKPWFWYAGLTKAGYFAQAGALIGAISVYGWFLRTTEAFPPEWSWVVLDLPVQTQATDPVVGSVLVGFPLAAALLNRPTTSAPPIPWPSGWEYNSPAELRAADPGTNVGEHNETRFRFGDDRAGGEGKNEPEPEPNQGDQRSSGTDSTRAVADERASTTEDSEVMETATDDSREPREKMRSTATGNEPAEESGDVWSTLEFDWTRPHYNEMSFNDIGGLESQKRELTRRVLKPARGSREVYEELGVTLPNVLLYGPPGTGKTYLSEAFIGELNAPHLLTSGGEITSRYINASSSRVAQMFREAKKLVDKYGVAVIFIDELDAVLPDRRGDGHQEDKKVVNEFLKFLDTCNEHNIIVVGATNYRDRLDDAAVRPGRMDVQIEVPLPGEAARAEIIRAQLESRAYTDAAYEEATTIAEHAPAASAADLATLVDEAALTAANKQATAIDDVHLYEGYRTVEDQVSNDDSDTNLE